MRAICIYCLFGISLPSVMYAQPDYWPNQTENQTGPTPDSTEGKFNVRVIIGQHFQYCGGAYPDEDQMNNYTPLSSAVFHLYNLDTGEKTAVKTNGKGILELNLLPGRYGLKELFKDCSFDEFYTNHRVPDYNDYEQGDESCYKNWWQSNFIEFVVTIPGSPQSFYHTFYHPCFTGINPCLNYFGPYPP